MIQIKGKKVLLLGLGLHGGGASTARWLLKNGAKLIVSDIKPMRVLKSSVLSLGRNKNLAFVFGKHREKDVKWADFIVYNPGVPKESKYLQLARRIGKSVYNEASLFFDRCRAQVVAVTGTRGKSTTASLISEMLKNSKKRSILAGNIRTSFMLDVVSRASESDIIVLELSSWQLEGLNIVRGAPKIAVVTNLYPDHLNRYRSLSHYYCSKKEIFKHQGGDNFLVLNFDDPILSGWASESCSRAVFFSNKDPKCEGVFVKGNKIIFRSGTNESEVAKIKDIVMTGRHNLQNTLAAIAVAKIMKVSNFAIKKTISNPPRLSGRQEEIGVINGIKFVNDTTSTTPEAGIAALEAFYDAKSRSKKIILIAGGADKNLDYSEWAQKAKKYCKRIYLLSGNASKKMQKNLLGFKNLSCGHNDLGFVLNDVLKYTKKGETVLFSPAAASFNLWNHEFERGDDFKNKFESVYDAL